MYLYYFTRSISHISLRKSLKNGTAKKESKRIKKFYCDCDKHKTQKVKAIVSEEINEIAINKCKWRAVDNGIVAIDSEGNILVSAFKFYIRHPDWKVGAASAIGLGKLNTEESIAVLFSLTLNSHYGIALAAVQSLEAIGSEAIISSLQKFRSENNVNRINRLISRALERLKIGVNSSNFIKQIVTKLQNKELLRKVSSQKERKNNVLIPRKIYHGVFTKFSLKRCLGSWDVRSRAHETTNMVVQLNGEKLRVKTKRNTSNDTKRNKLNYLINLFFNNTFLVDHIQNNIHPLSGDVYWAVTDTTDPKITRPVLVLKAMNRLAGDYLVAPLTSDTTNPKGGLHVEINDKKSCVQLSRQKVVHRSLLLNKYGTLAQKDLDKILALENIGCLKTERVKRYISHKKKLFSKATRHCPDKYYKIDIRSELLMTDHDLKSKEYTSKKEKETKPHPIILSDFFKPELKQLLGMELKSNRKEKQKNTSRNIKKMKAN